MLLFRLKISDYREVKLRIGERMNDGDVPEKYSKLYQRAFGGVYLRRAMFSFTVGAFLIRAKNRGARGKHSLQKTKHLTESVTRMSPTQLDP